MIRNVDHIGIAVRALEDRLKFWSEGMGLEVEGMETVESEKVRVAFLPAGRTRVELLEATDDDSPIAKHIERRGEGIHHITFEVDDIEKMLAAMETAGVQVLGDGAREGAGGHKVAFLHPKSTGGVLVEFVELPPEHESESSNEVAVGSVVLVYLREPQEKIWGVLRRLDATGVTIQGLDLHSFEDWLGGLDRDEDDRIGGPSVVFAPMARLEKILLDQPDGAVPSLSQRVERRTGSSVKELFARS